MEHSIVPFSQKSFICFQDVKPLDNFANNVIFFFFKNSLNLFRKHILCAFQTDPPIKSWQMIWVQVTTAEHENSLGLLFPCHVLHLTVTGTIEHSLVGIHNLLYMLWVFFRVSTGTNELRPSVEYVSFGLFINEFATSCNIERHLKGNEA